MPECVNSYAKNKSFHDVFDIQFDLINTFRQDFSKYATHSDKRCLNSVLLTIPQKIGSQIKYAHLAENFTNPTIKKAFELLETARIFKKISASSPTGIPLGANTSDKIFKALFLDIGLLSRLNGLSTSVEFQKTDLLSFFRGLLAEQFVGQEILSSGTKELYYWSRQAKNSNAETDYLIEKQNEIIPIEVKSGSSGSLKSLHLLLNTYPNIKNAYVFSDAVYGELPEKKLIFMPLYFAFSACT
jgi:predicted AAA+ superfamily ATPase